MNANRNDKNGSVDHPYFDKQSDPLLRAGGRLPTQIGPRLDWRQAVGGLLIAGGFISLVVGYFGISGTTKTYDQLTFFLSNGLGGAAAIIVGSTFLVIREHVADRLAMRLIDERLIQMDGRLPGEGMRRAGSRSEPAGSHAHGSVPTAASRQPA